MQGIGAGTLYDAIVKAARENNPENEGDYRNEDGLLMCGKCHTKKETITPIQNIGGTIRGGTVIPYACECRRERERQEEEAKKREEAKRRIEAMRKNGLADEQYKACTFSADDGSDQEASQFCRAYVREWEWAQETNSGIMLYGDVGGGKTFLAACIANALIDKGVPVMMTTIPRLVSAMGKDFGENREAILRQISSIPLLVLDDIGTERNTSYGMELVYEIINTRYKSQKPLIVTTNLTMTAVKEVEDIGYRRIYDRVVEMCAPLKVSCSGRRQKAARSKLEEMRERFRGGGDV